MTVPVKCVGEKSGTIFQISQKEAVKNGKDSYGNS